MKKSQIWHIPICFDAAFVFLISIAKQLSEKTGIAFARFVTALGVDLIIGHCIIIPTPGPMAVAGTETLRLDRSYSIHCWSRSLPNDSGFSFPQTIKSWTTGGFVAGLSGLCIVLILSVFQGVLPGLM